MIGKLAREISIFLMLIMLPLFMQAVPRIASLLWLFVDRGAPYLATLRVSFLLIVLYILIVSSLLFWAKQKDKHQLCAHIYSWVIVGIFLSIFTIAYPDFFWIFENLLLQNLNPLWSNQITQYFIEVYPLYLTLLLLIFAAHIMQWRFIKPEHQYIPQFYVKKILKILAFLMPFLVTFPLSFMCLALSIKTQSSAAILGYSSGLIGSVNSVYFLWVVALFFSAFYLKKNSKISIGWLIHLTNIAGIGTMLCLALQILMIFASHYFSGIPMSALGIPYLAQKGLSLLPIFLSGLWIGGIRQAIEREQFNTEKKKDTSGNFGTAEWADEKECLSFNLYSSQNGIPFGTDEKGRMLYYPLKTKMTLSPQGTGKTVCSSIPGLLTHDGPAFIFDIKGELWATTARYRSETLGRKIVVIDPYRLTKSEDFIKGKPENLLFDYTFNPFDFVPEEEYKRDRMINAFASSFVINEKDSGAALHFDENAKILIRGYIDFMMKTMPKESRNLQVLFELLSEDQESAMATFAAMTESEGRAAAASNQISRVGTDERGSILSTTYRQIDWMGDKNIQRTLEKSNFDLRDFLKGNMDIYVVLPEDQVKEHNRLVRMMLSLLQSIIVQANPRDLPEKKILFLLEEVAQLGYTPDVEKAIEVLRGRGVVVWAVFQTMTQVKKFEKPDLFTGAHFKQLFTLDDPDTMEWMQKLGCTETVLTKTISANTGDSKQRFQVLGGTVSKGDGESIQETGVSLIKTNEIREMPPDEQFVFLHGIKPIRCKKLYYLQHLFFEGKYDENPLEMEKKSKKRAESISS
jgi:type IV secretion system protein VirD4